jgi:hypothetical protein
MKRTPNEEIIHNDIMRYKTNKLASTLALVSLLFNVLYFCLLYGFRDTYFGTWLIGISVIVTLFSLLITFLSSEGIKNYKKKYAIVLLVLALVQIVRIFILPLKALQYDASDAANAALSTRYFGVDMGSAACFTWLTIWLCLSAACLVASAVIGYINCVKREKFNAQLESKEVVLEDVLKQMDEEDAGKFASETNQVQKDGGVK